MIGMLIHGSQLTQIRTKPQDDKGAVGKLKEFLGVEPNEISDRVITFDTVDDETYEYTALISDNPVEFGIDVTDNYRRQPLRIKKSIIVSDTPIIAGVLGGLTGNVTGALGGLQNLIEKKAARHKQALDLIVGLMDNSVIFTLVDGLKKFDDMMVEGFQPTRNSKTGNGALFGTITFKQVRIVSTEMVKLTGLPDAAKKTIDSGDKAAKGAASSAAAGASKATEAAKAGAEQASSTLKKIADGIGSVL